MAITQLVFNNRDLIDLFKKRGAAIKNENKNALDKVNEQINALKDDDLSTPCSIFMTFETEEGITRALNYDEHVYADPNLSDLKTWLGD